MEHELRAEYEEGARPSDGAEYVKIWHVVRGEGHRAMCGRELEPDAAVRSADLWGTSGSGPFCHSCGALYLREVP